MEWQIEKITKRRERNVPTISFFENGTITFSSTAMKELQKHTPDQDINELDKADLMHNKETGEYAFKFGKTGQLKIQSKDNPKDKRTYNRAIKDTLNYTGRIYIKRFEPYMMIFEIKEKEEG